jgi:putative transcriptional regulator
VLACTPADLMVCEPDKVAARRPPAAATGTKPGLAPRLGRHRSVPPA